MDCNEQGSPDHPLHGPKGKECLQIYSVENYKDCIRFNKQYDEIRSFLKTVADQGYNEQEGVPEEPSEEVSRAEKYLELSEYIKVFVVKGGEYVAHCGVWYDDGNTAYIEPVVTVPEHRGKGLGRAVVYEAINCAKKRGAKRAIVYSGQEFYLHLGMVKSSEVGTWVKMQPMTHQ